MIVSEKPPLLEERSFSRRWPSYKRVNSEPGLDPNSLRSILFQFSKSPIRLSRSIEVGKEYTSGMACLSVSRSKPGSPTQAFQVGWETRPGIMRQFFNIQSLGWICRRCSSSSADLSKKAADSLEFKIPSLLSSQAKMMGSLYFTIQFNISCLPVPSDKLPDSSDLRPSELVAEQGRLLLPVGNRGEQTHRGGPKYRLRA